MLLFKQNAIDTAGLKWAPEIVPNVYIITATIRPKIIGIESTEIELGLISYRIIEPHPKKTKAYVPKNSAKNLAKLVFIIIEYVCLLLFDLVLFYKLP